MKSRSIARGRPAWLLMLTRTDTESPVSDADKANQIGTNADAERASLWWLGPPLGPPQRLPWGEKERQNQQKKRTSGPLQSNQWREDSSGPRGKCKLPK